MTFTTPRQHGWSRLTPIIGTALTIAACVAGAAQARVTHAGNVPLPTGRHAIEQFASKVAHMTHATSYRVSQCSGSGTGVDCGVRWNYPNEGISCGLKASARYVGGAMAVRRASSISCTRLGSN